MSRPISPFRRLLTSPVVWGTLATLLFYGAIHRGPLEHEFIDRYLASHPVEYLSITMFLIGLAALVLRGAGLLSEHRLLNVELLPAPQPGGDPVERTGELLECLDVAPATHRRSPLWQRLRDAVEYVERKGTADTLDEHLRYQADISAETSQTNYSLVRIIIWAIPILGFLGTVIGITLAIAKLGPQDLENSLPAVVDGLKIAFDTTALALALSILLMFAQYLVERIESQLLAKVEGRLAGLLVGRFREYGARTDPHLASVKRMVESVAESCQQLVERQTELWRSSLEAAQEAWQANMANSGRSIQAALQEGARGLAAANQSHREQWQAIDSTIAENSRSLERHREQLTQQHRLLAQFSGAPGSRGTVERMLDDQLSTRAHLRQLQETMGGLTVAVERLHSQLRGWPTVVGGANRTQPSRQQLTPPAEAGGSSDEPTRAA